MKFHWLLPSSIGIFLLSSPAEAAKLRSWRFNAKQNRLEFNTDGKVQPQAKLIFNPTRLVIDLPGTNLEQPTAKQQYGGAIRSVRVGQFEDNMTRLVVEFSPGYQIDPQQVKFNGSTPSQWTVQLPSPQKVAENPQISAAPPPQPASAAKPPAAVAATTASPKLFSVVTPDANSATSNRQSPPEKTAPQTNTAQATVEVESVRATPDGFFIRTRGGGTPKLEVDRNRSRDKIEVELKGATLAPQAQPNTPINQFGVKNIELKQTKKSPPVVRMTMRVNKNSPDWRATVSRLGGVVLLPRGGMVAANNASNSRSQPEPRETVVAETAPARQAAEIANPSPDPATIQSVELAEDGKQLRIKADQVLTYASGWDQASSAYSITIPNARLDQSVEGPSLDSKSPVLRVRLRQSDPRTVQILIQPAAGVRIGDVAQPQPELLALELKRFSTIYVPPQAPNESIPVPDAAKPSAPQQRAIVMVDPGHGGKDPGAIGIGGLQEKQVILPIAKQVAEILERKGVKAIMTRDSDYFVDLGPRVATAAGYKADVFVSIHANSMGLNRPDVNGLETYYFASPKLAQTIHNSVLQNIDGIRDRGVRKARFYVLRKSSMPSVLVEVGYVTGREDVVRLRTAAYQKEMAEAIAEGVLRYLNLK